MNKEQNINLVKSFYAAQIPLDLDRVIDFTTPNIVWSSQCSAANVLAGTYTALHGQDELRTLFSSIDSDVEFESTNFQNFLAEGDKVAVLARSKWMNKRTGKKVEYDWIRIFTIEDGKIAKQEGLDCTSCVLEAFTLDN